jgi:ribosomal-protein-alanine N-acetyltransferase
MTAITLRRTTPADAQLIHSWRIEPSTASFQPILPLSVNDVRSMLIERSRPEIGPAATGKFQWIIQSPDEPVGWVTLEINSNGRRHAMGVIGYTVAERFRGRGYGTAGLRALLPIAFGRGGLNLERLEAVAAVDNTPSRLLLESAGFQQEGVLRGLLIIDGRRVDHAIYGLLRTDWGE